MNVREIAWRLFSQEFNSATLDLSAEEERAPSYVVTPLGAKVNRLFVVGVVTEVDTMGEAETPMRRARLVDPTGNYYVSAGQFQPEASRVLAELKPPEFVAVVGKARTYAPDDSIRLLSIRPESIVRCDSALRDHWVYESCISTRMRIGVMKEVLDMSAPSVQELEKLGYPRYLAEGAVAAAEHYGETDLERFEGIVVDALREILSDGAGELREIAFEEVVPSPDAKDVEVSVQTSDQPSEDEEEAVLRIVDALDKNGKGARWDEMVVVAQKGGIGRERLEEICADLLDNGDIYEPELGRMKRI